MNHALNNHHPQMENNELLARIGTIMTGVFGLATWIDPQWATAMITAFSGIPVGIHYILKSRKTQLEIRMLKKQIEEQEAEREGDPVI